MCYIFFFLLLAIFLLGKTFFKLNYLSNELSYLAHVNSFPYSNHHLLNHNISDFIETKNKFEKETTFLIMSPTCEVCHDKLEIILKSKSKKKERMLFYADAHNKSKYDEMVGKFREIKIHPLSITQIQNLNKGMFPLYIDVTTEGIITKVYLK